MHFSDSINLRAGVEDHFWVAFGALGGAALVVGEPLLVWAEFKAF